MPHLTMLTKAIAFTQSAIEDYKAKNELHTNCSLSHQGQIPCWRYACPHPRTPQSPKFQALCCSHSINQAAGHKCSPAAPEPNKTLLAFNLHYSTQAHRALVSELENPCQDHKKITGGLVRHKRIARGVVEHRVHTCSKPKSCGCFEGGAEAMRLGACAFVVCSMARQKSSTRPGWGRMSSGFSQCCIFSAGLPACRRVIHWVRRRVND